MRSMKGKILLVVIVVGALAALFYRNSQGSSFGGGYSGSGFGWKQRLEMSAAADADEWLKRRALDKKHTSHDVLGHWYAELPPEAEWEKLIDAIEQDSAKPADQSNQGHFFSSSQLTPEKERLFAMLLDEDEEGARALLRELIQNGPAHNYSFNRESILDAVLSLSEDAEEGLEWLKDHQPALLAKRSGSSSKHYSSKKPWEEALREASLEEAETILKEGLDGEDRDRKLERLLKIAELSGDQELREEVVELLWDEAQKKFQEEFSHGHHYWNSTLVQALAQDEEWDRLKFLSSESERQRKASEKKGHYYHSRNDVLEWVLAYHIDGAEAFLQKMDAELGGGTLSLKKAYSLIKADLGPTIVVGSLYVDALVEAGRTEEAWAVAQRLVAMNLRQDRFYEQARKVDPGKFASYLDRLMEFDPFEERPLIWKAELALEAGEIEEAKEWAEKAIALDPSDGDQGKDSRMKVYEVLSRVLAKAGDQEKSDFFREVMIAIREGEVADDFLYVGLIKEATGRYAEALGHFEDAYCLQSRLALTLARDGQFARAVPHFEKAFELMPVSFGPRESHCFGCEGLFSDERVRPIAQRILSEFMNKNPDNARAPYLLGLVLDSMGEEEEAAKAFRKALELDPRYFNAANRLFELLKGDPAAHDEQKALLTAILRIAPYGELGRYYEMRTDLKQAWIGAGKVSESPLQLAGWGFKPMPPTEQFEESSGSFFWFSTAEKAMDGWSREELCRENRLVKMIEDL